jgi:subtilisin family serine protease/glutamine cyclotransferase
MKTPLRIFGTIFLLLSLTLVTMPGVHAISPSGSEPQAISFPSVEPEAKVSALLSLQVEAKQRCQQVQPTAGELSMMQAQGMNTEDLETQRVFIHLAQEPTAKQLKELEAMGIIPYPDSWIPPVGEFPTGFIVAETPIDKLGILAGRDYVTQLDTAEQLLEPQNDQAAIAINADDVWDSGYDGTDVRVAVLDSGLDTSHPDIPAPVASKDYSDWPVLDDTIANSVTGHGTHVAGSALGRGTQSAGATSEYKGMAPDADLIFLKIGNDTNGNASLDAMTNAIKDAVDTYEADIITMSYGGWGYYHDGTRQTSQAVDYAFSQGAVVFISAGNDAADGEHYSGTVDAYSSTGFIQVDVSGSAGDNVLLGFNLVWFDGLAENNDLALEYYDSTQTAMEDIWASAQEESWKGTEHELSGYGPEAGWYYYLPAGSPTYYLKVTNNSGSQQFFHIYFYGGASSGASVEFQDADPFYTLGSPADAEKAIAVGAYTSRKNWTAYEGTTYHYINPEQTVGTMAYFSSRGPRVDSGAPQKPNLAAPGSAVISVRDQDVYAWPGGASAYFVDNDGLDLDGSGPADYYVMQGTSMACPTAAGAAALLLEANPALKGHPGDVRNLLQSTASSVDANDNIDGYGLIDVQAAVDATASEFELDWVFMVYLDADNNLESAGIDDMNEMETAGSNDNVAIVVQMDRAERDYYDDTTNGNWTGAKRFYVTQDTDASIINSPVIEDLGEVNMGDPAVLQSFIEWVVANYPANHYALVLWNHGSGWRERESGGESVKSICIDDESGDELTMTELRSALNAVNLSTGKTLDIVGFDACLMQMVEVAYQVMGSASRPLVDITVGSEETEPGDGWDYAATLTALTANPAMTPAGLATQIVNDYVSSYSSSLDITQSGVDLDYMEALATAVDSFAIAMTNATGDWTAISTARSQAQEYYYYYYIDLYHFAQLVNQDATISQTVRDAASDVMAAVTNAVIAEGHTASVGNSHGISIYYPETSGNYFPAYETDILFTTDTHWDDFLYAILFTSPSVPDITVSPTSFDVALAPDTTEDYTLTISNDGTGELTYDISDQEASGSQPQTTIESTPAAEPGIDAFGNEVAGEPEPTKMTVPRSAGEVITSFSAPGTGPLGLAYDGTYLWNADWETEMIYKLDPSTGSVVQSFSSPGGRPFGLTYDGTYLWVTVRDDNTIYQLNPATGSVVDSIPSPGVNPQGLTWDGEYLWVAEYYDNDIYKLDPADGSILQSFSWTGTYTGGLAWDGAYLWHCDSDFNTIYKLNPTSGSVVTSFSSPYDWPAGLTWDGTYLWSSDSSEDTIYKIDVGEQQQDCSWLSEAPISGAVAASGSDPITVTIDTTGLSVGTYNAEITITSNDPDEASVTVPVALEVITVPDISVLPVSYEVTLPPDTVEGYGMTIGNDGGGELTYEISDQEAGTLSMPLDAGGSLEEDKKAVISRNPDQTLTSTEYDMSIAVSDLSSFGRYTEATADELLLLYGYPYAGSSYMTVQLDGSDYYQDATMDTYVTQTPTIDGDNIITQWTLPTDVGVSLRLTLQQDTTRYHATIINNDSASHEVKIRFLLDTMLAYNDGAPFIVPGVGNVTTEQEYTNPVFDYWQATDSLSSPTLTSNCTFSAGNKPYKVQFAYWWDIYDVPFDYVITEGQSITSDTAVGMYWDLGTLSAGQSQEVAFYYGTTDAIIGTPEVSIVTLFTDADSYLAEEDVTVYVDVGNGGDAALTDGSVAVSIQEPEGTVVFEESTAITVAAGEVSSCNFTYSLPAGAVAGEYTITANVYDAEDALLDEATTSFAVTSTDCAWLSESPVSGAVAAGGSDAITVTINTTGLSVGTYNAEIIVASNDPDEASVTVPVTLHVSATELPTVTSVSPDSGEQGETLSVNIDGTNLTGATAVSFGDGITVNSFSVVSATEILTNISIDTTATPGLRDVSVTTSAGTGTLEDGFTVVAAGAVTVSVDAPDTAAPDSDFTANIDISQVTELDSCNYDITFDPLVLRLDDVATGMIGSTTIPVDMYNEISSGTYRVVQNVPGLTGVTGSGYLAVLHFHVIGSDGDSSAITLTNGTLSDAQAAEIEATWVGDSVSITSALAGDANGDGMVNALDITKVERVIVGLDAETPGADANGDGMVNALDITKIERIIVGLD